MNETIACSNVAKRKAFAAARQDDCMSSDGNDRTSDSSPELHPTTDTSGSDSSNSNKPRAFDGVDNSNSRRVKSKKSMWDSIPSVSADLAKPSHFGLCQFSAVKEQDGFKKPAPPPASTLTHTLTALAAHVQQQSIANAPLQMPNHSSFVQPPPVLPATTTTDPSHHIIIELLKNATQASMQSLQQEQKSPPKNTEPVSARTHVQPLSIGMHPSSTQVPPQDASRFNRLSRENIELVQTLIALSSNNGRASANSTVAGLYAQQIPIAPALHPHNDRDVMSGSFPMAMDTDDERMSHYQIMVRQQLEFFIADKSDVESSTQGRKKPVVLGQVGIRCRHCATAAQRKRVRGAVYFPTKLDGIYQASQNMSTTHLLTSCQAMGEVARKKLLKLKETKLIAMAGKQEWAEGCRKIGIYEVEGGGLRMTKSQAVALVTNR